MVTLALLFCCFVQFPRHKCVSWTALKSIEGYWKNCQSTQCNNIFLRPYTFSIQRFHQDSVQLLLSSRNKVLAGTSNLSYLHNDTKIWSPTWFFFLTYCFIEERPLNFTMCLSTLCNSSLETVSEKLFLKWSVTGRILNPLSFLSLFALSDGGF